jgi:hypothetical protein
MVTLLPPKRPLPVFMKIPKLDCAIKPPEQRELGYLPKEKLGLKNISLAIRVKRPCLFIEEYRRKTQFVSTKERPSPVFSALFPIN